MRRLIAAVAGLLVCLTGVAQTHYEGNISIGGKAGVTLSRINFSPGVKQQLLPGMMAGATFRYIEENHFGLIAELNIEQRGWKEKFEDIDYQFQHRLTYIQLPIMTHVYFGNDRIHGYFNAGPEVGFMIADGIKSNFDYEQAAALSYFDENSRHIEQYTLPIKHKFDYGISAGVGAELFTGARNSFTVEGRFYYGLNDIFANRKTDIFSGSAGMSIMITLGYFYRLK